MGYQKAIKVSNRETATLHKETSHITVLLNGKIYLLPNEVEIRRLSYIPPQLIEDVVQEIWRAYIENKNVNSVVSGFERRERLHSNREITNQNDMIGDQESDECF